MRFLFTGEQAGLDNGRRRGAVAAFAALATCGLMLLGAWVTRTYETTRGLGTIAVDPAATPFWGPLKVNAYLIRQLSMYDSRGQSQGYRVALLGTALLTLAAPVLRRLLPAFERPTVEAAVFGFAVVTGLVFYGLCMRCGHRPWLTRVTVAAFFPTLAIAWAGPRFCRGTLNRAGGVLVVGAVLAATLPAFFTVIDLSGASRFSIVSYQEHFAAVLGSVDRLAAGERLVKDVFPSYGLLFHMLLAGYERQVRPLTVGDTILVFQVMQFVYLALCALLYLGFSRGKWWFCLLALLIVLPWYLFNHQAVVMPNQSAWRTIGFPAAVLALRATHSARLSVSAFVLGVVGGLIVLQNAEAGIAAGLGLGAYLFLRARSTATPGWSAAVIPLATFPLGLTAAWLVFALLGRLLVGSWPDPLVIKQVRDGVASASAIGIGGLRFPGDLLPVALFGWSAFALIAISLMRRGPLSLPHGVRVCVAVIGLIWLAYYVNRPAYWSLSSFCFLYGFPAIDALRTLVSGSRRRRLGTAAVASAFALTALITIPTLYKNFDNYRIYKMPYQWRGDLRSRSTESAPDRDRAWLSGVLLEGQLAREIAAKARVIASKGRTGPVIYLSMDSYLIAKLSGVNSVQPRNGLLFEAWTEDQYLRLLDAIERAGLGEIYVDPPDPRAKDSGRYFVAFYERFLRDLGGRYERDRRVGGWDVWIPKRRAAASAASSLSKSAGTSMAEAGRSAGPSLAIHPSHRARCKNARFPLP